jgi:chromosome segregation ATPase
MILTIRDMPRFMNFPIADDSASVSARTVSNTGFIESDIPLLDYFRILKKTPQGKVLNTDLVQNPQEVRDFLFWASGKRGLPLPPIVRKVLCLKRATLKSGISSINTSNKLRTGESKILAEIDSLLRLDGAKNPDDPESCPAEGSTFVSGSTTPEQTPETKASEKGACVTHVHCDNASVIELLTKIYASIQQLESSAGTKAGVQQLQGLKNAVSVLSASTGDPGSLAAETAKKAADASAAGEIETVKRSLNALQSELSLLTTITKGNHEHIRALLMTVGRSMQPIDTKLTEIMAILNRIAQRPEADLGQILAAIERLPPTATEARAAAAALPAAAATGNETLRTALQELATLIQGQAPEFATVRGAVNALVTQLDPRIAAIEAGLTALRAQIGNVATVNEAIVQLTTQLRGTPDNIAQIAARLGTLETAIGGLARPPQEIAGMMAIVTAVERLVRESVVKREDLAAMLTEIQTSLQTAVRTLSERPGNFDAVLESLNRSLPVLLGNALAPISGQLDSLVEDTAGIVGNVDTMKENVRGTKTTVDALMREVATLRQELGGMRQNMGAGQATIMRKLDSITIDIERFQQLCAATRCPEESFQAILDALRASTANIVEQIGALQRGNIGGRNNGAIQNNQELLDQIAALQANIQGRAAALEQSGAELEELRAQIQQKETELADLRASGGRQTGVVQNLQERIAAKNAREGALTAELEQLRARLQQLERDATQEREAAARTLAQLTQEHELLQAAVAEKDQHIADLMAQLAAGAATREAIQAQLAAKTTESERLQRNLEATGLAHETDNAALQAQLDEANAAIRGLRLSLSRLDDIDRVEAERAEFERLLNECNASKTELQHQLDALRAQSAQEREALGAAVERARAKLLERNAHYEQRLNDQRESLTRDCDERLRALQEEFDMAVREQIAKGESVGKTAKAEADRLRSELEAARREAQSAIRTAVAEKDATIASLTSRIETLQRDHNTAGQRATQESIAQIRQQYEAQIGALEDEIEDLRETARLREAEKQELTQARGMSNALAAGMRQRANELETALQKAKSDCDEEKGTITAQRNSALGEKDQELQELRETLRREAEQSSAKNITIRDLEQTHARLLAGLEQTRGWDERIQYLQGELRRFEGLHHQAEMGKAGVEKRLSEMKAERDALQAQLEAAGSKDADIAAIAQQLRATQAKLDAKVLEYNKLFEDCNKKAADLEAAKASSSSSRGEMERLTRDLEAAQARLSALDGAAKKVLASAAAQAPAAAAAAGEPKIISSQSAAAVEIPAELLPEFKDVPAVTLRQKLGEGLRFIYSGRSQKNSAVPETVRLMAFEILNQLIASHLHEGPTKHAPPDYAALKSQLAYIYNRPEFSKISSRTIEDFNQSFTFDPKLNYTNRLLDLFAMKLIGYIINIKPAPVRLQPRAGAAAAGAAAAAAAGAPSESNNGYSVAAALGSPHLGKMHRPVRGFGFPTPERVFKPQAPKPFEPLNQFSLRFGTRHGGRRKNISNRKTRKLRK